MKRLAFLLWLICSVACGQIEGPTIVEKSPPNPIVFSVKAPMPEGAEFTGGWHIVPVEGVGQSSDPVPLAEPNTVGVWAESGTKYRLTFSGFWLHLGPEITVTDIHGNPQKFRPYLGHGMVNFTHDFVVGKSAPPPPPPVPGEKFGLIVEDVKSRPVGTGDLWQKLRAVYGINKLLIVDKRAGAASLQKYLDQVTSYPTLLVISKAGEVIRQVPVSGTTTVDAVKELLGE